MERGIFKKRLRRQEVVYRGLIMSILILAVGMVAFLLWFRIIEDYKTLAQSVEAMDGMVLVGALVTSCCFCVLVFHTITNFRVAYKKAMKYENWLETKV